MQEEGAFFVHFEPELYFLAEARLLPKAIFGKQTNYKPRILFREIDETNEPELYFGK